MDNNEDNLSANYFVYITQPFLQPCKLSMELLKLVRSQCFLHFRYTEDTSTNTNISTFIYNLYKRQIEGHLFTLANGILSTEFLNNLKDCINLVLKLN